MKSKIGFAFVCSLQFVWAQPGNVGVIKNRLGLDSSASPNTLSASEKQQGWSLLWDGKTFDGWGIFSATNPESHWKIAADGLTTTGTKWDTDLKTKNRYGNFIWSIEWKNTERGVNSGLIYWSFDTLNAPSYATGIEQQILGKTSRYYDTETRNRAGSCYGIIRASLGGANPDGLYYDATQPELDNKAAYNHAVIIVNGLHHQYWLNGVKTVDFVVGSIDFKMRQAASKWAENGSYPNWAKFPNGHLVLQNHGSGATFRNIKVRVLPEKATESVIWPLVTTQISAKKFTNRNSGSNKLNSKRAFFMDTWHSLVGKRLLQ